MPVVSIGGIANNLRIVQIQRKQESASAMYVETMLRSRGETEKLPCSSSLLHSGIIVVDE